MELREPYYVENLGRDQPYLSMLLIAPCCTFKCAGCQNKHLGYNHIKDFSTKQLRELYLSNPFFQGITIGGLEIFDSGNIFEEEVLKFIIESHIEKVTIYTRYNKTHEKVRIFIDKIKKISTIKEFYLKTGEFKLQEKNENHITIGNWSLDLYNKEQNFERII